ncbi:hypothetical protein SMICM304S_00781 [Streptomyces microflavus]
MRPHEEPSGCDPRMRPHEEPSGCDPLMRRDVIHSLLVANRGEIACRIFLHRS